MKKILVIEDNADVRENLGELLELSNYEVLKAENGRVGATLAIKEQPDLIICDIMMPVMDGYGVLRILSKRPETSDIPFIFLSAKAEKADFRKGMNLVADDYVSKPFDDVELLDAVELRLRKSVRLRDQQREPDLNRFLKEAKSYAIFESLIEECEVRTYRKKDVLYEEGGYPHQVFFINSGKVKLYKTNEDGKEIIIEILSEKEFLGFIPLIRNDRHTTCAAALEERKVSILPREDFSNLLYKNTNVAGQLIKMLANHVTEIEEKLLNLAYDSVRKRVADALILLHDRFEKDGQSEITILREDLAHFVGTSKETVIRTLSEFKDDALVEIKGSRIRLLDKEKLARLPY
mgnify:CR=1 FL=1